MKNKHYASLVVALLVLVVAGSAYAVGTGTSATKSADKNVTVQFKDVPVKDALEIIFQGRGLNYMLDPTATGTVNASLTDVSFETALHAMLKSAKLTVTKDQGIYIISPQKEAAATTTATTEIVTQPTIDIDREKLPEKIPVGYADVIDMAALLSGNQSNSRTSMFGNSGYQGMGGMNNMGMGFNGMGGFGQQNNYGGGYGSRYGNNYGNSNYGNSGYGGYGGYGNNNRYGSGYGGYGGYGSRY